MPLDTVDWRIQDCALTLNTCTCCGLPFTSEGVWSRWTGVLNDFDSTFVRTYAGARTAFQTVQQAHLMHKMQRKEGQKCMLLDETKPDGPYQEQPGAVGGGGAGDDEGDGEDGDDEEEDSDSEKEDQEDADPDEEASVSFLSSPLPLSLL
eukprot:3936105-Rhodomonas_salina.8